ncbi:hypothetical protein CLF_105020 [Clonorchis sinensis]|uniref:Uncharacterized protein n=1 Tax=Clonorchis sinensis TaxID=79923 RepID=G7YCT3_CLOSI|nr:hypothetical protein CLF_105020 [Clonorchis sinensis]
MADASVPLSRIGIKRIDQFTRTVMSWFLVLLAFLLSCNVLCVRRSERKYFGRIPVVRCHTTEGNTRDEILSSCTNRERRSRDTRVRFEPRTFQSVITRNITHTASTSGQKTDKHGPQICENYIRTMDKIREHPTESENRLKESHFSGSKFTTNHSHHTIQVQNCNCVNWEDSEGVLKHEDVTKSRQRKPTPSTGRDTDIYAPTAKQVVMLTWKHHHIGDQIEHDTPVKVESDSSSIIISIETPSMKADVVPISIPAFGQVGGQSDLAQTLDTPSIDVCYFHKIQIQHPSRVTEFTVAGYEIPVILQVNLMCTNFREQKRSSDARIKHMFHLTHHKPYDCYYMHPPPHYYPNFVADERLRTMTLTNVLVRNIIQSSRDDLCSTVVYRNSIMIVRLILCCNNYNRAKFLHFPINKCLIRSF